MTTSGRPTSSMPRTNAAMLMTGAILPIHQRRFADVKTELLKHVDIGYLAKDADTPPQRISGGQRPGMRFASASMLREGLAA